MRCQQLKQTSDPMGRVVTNKPIAASAAISIVAVTISLFVKFGVTSGYKGMYLNEMTSWISPSSARTQNAIWVQAQGMNAVDVYGMDSYLANSANWNRVAESNLMMRQRGVKDIGFVYSSEGSIRLLDAFNKAQKNDSCKFSSLTSEIEQYNTGKRTEFYSAIKAAHAYAKANGLVSKVYQGWPSPADVDSIVKYSDMTLLHCYISSSKYSSGSYIYGYMSSRLSVFADASSRIRPGRPYPVIALASCEPARDGNPEYGWTYFKTNSWDSFFSRLSSYASANAPAKVKSNISFAGSQIFVKEFARQLKP